MAESIDEEVSQLDEYKITRKRRVPSRVRQKRKRYYRRNRSKIKRKQKRYRRKPRVKRLAKRRIKIRKRLHLRPGSRRRIHMSTDKKSNLNENLKNSKVVEFSIEDLGIEHPDYFQGAGVYGSKWDEVSVGIGSSAYDAGQDAMEMLAQSGYEFDLSQVESDMEDELAKLSHKADAKDENQHYVAIYVKANSAKESMDMDEIKKLKEEFSDNGKSDLIRGFTEAANLAESLNENFAPLIEARTIHSKPLNEEKSVLAEEKSIPDELFDLDPLSLLPTDELPATIAFSNRLDATRLDEDFEGMLKTKVFNNPKPKKLTESQKKLVEATQTVKSDLTTLAEDAKKMLRYVELGALSVDEANDILGTMAEYLEKTMDKVGLTEDEESIKREDYVKAVSGHFKGKIGWVARVSDDSASVVWKGVWDHGIWTPLEDLVKISSEEAGDFAQESKQMTEAGEMFKSELEPGGDWHQVRVDMEQVMKDAGVKGGVEPFDQYQGPKGIIPSHHAFIWLNGEENPDEPGMFVLEYKGDFFPFDDGHELKELLHRVQRSKSEAVNEEDEDEDEIDIDELMERWRDHDGYSDYNLMLDRNLYEMAADFLSGAGATEEDNAENRAINKLADEYKGQVKEESEKEFFKNMEVWLHPSTNEHQFIPVGDPGLNYFTGKKDLERGGYKFDSGYDDEGKEYKESKMDEAVSEDCPQGDDLRTEPEKETGLTAEASPHQIKAGEDGEIVTSLDDTTAIWKNKHGYYWLDKFAHQMSHEYFKTEKEAHDDAKENADLKESKKKVSEGYHEGQVIEKEGKYHVKVGKHDLPIRNQSQGPGLVGKTVSFEKDDNGEAVIMKHISETEMSADTTVATGGTQMYGKIGDAKDDGPEFYVEPSSIFQSAPYYQAEKMAEVLKKAGLKDVHLEPQFGWSNQPDVVVFKGDIKRAQKAIKDSGLHPNLKTWDAIISPKEDWEEGRATEDLDAPIGNAAHSTETFRLAKNGMAEAKPQIGTVVAELVRAAKRYQTSIPALLKTPDYEHYKDLEPEIMKEYHRQQKELRGESVELSEADPSLAPPKKWFNKMKKRIKSGNPSYDQDQIDKTIGDIWYHKLSTAKKKEIRGSEGKEYGPAEDRIMQDAELALEEAKKFLPEARGILDKSPIHTGAIIDGAMERYKEKTGEDVKGQSNVLWKEFDLFANQVVQKHPYLKKLLKDNPELVRDALAHEAEDWLKKWVQKNQKKKQKKEDTRVDQEPFKQGAGTSQMLSKSEQAAGGDEDAYPDEADGMLVSKESLDQWGVPVTEEADKSALILKPGVNLDKEKLKELGKQLNVKVSLKKHKDGDVLKLDTNHKSIYDHARNLIGHDKVQQIKVGEAAVHESYEEVIGEANPISKLKGDHKKAVEMAIQQLKDDGNEAIAKKIETGKMSLKQAGDWAEDQNYHGLASVFWNEPGVDHAVVMRGELSHRNADLGSGEEYAGERDGALAAKYDAAYGQKDAWDEEKLETDIWGKDIQNRKLRTLIFLDHHNMTDSSTFQNALKHVEAHKDLYKKHLQDVIANMEKHMKEIGHDEYTSGWNKKEQDKVKKYYADRIKKNTEFGKKYGLL